MLTHTHLHTHSNMHSLIHSLNQSRWLTLLVICLISYLLILTPPKFHFHRRTIVPCSWRRHAHRRSWLSRSPLICKYCLHLWSHQLHSITQSLSINHLFALTINHSLSHVLNLSLTLTAPLTFHSLTHKFIKILTLSLSQSEYTHLLNHWVLYLLTCYPAHTLVPSITFPYTL